MLAGLGGLDVVVEHDVGPPEDLANEDLWKDFLAAAAAAGLGHRHPPVPGSGGEKRNLVT